MIAASPQTHVGKVVLVTGGAQGLGRAICHRIVASGGKVVVADLNADKAGAVAGELGGDGAFAAGVDVSDREAVGGLVNDALRRFGRIDGLVNSVAIFSTIEMKPF